MKDIIISFITFAIPSITTVITTKGIRKQNNKHSARQSILQLIMEDRVRNLEGKLPENKQAILHEFDEYQANGGNSYIKEKVEEYLQWYSSLNKKEGD